MRCEDSIMKKTILIAVAVLIVLTATGYLFISNPPHWLLDAAAKNVLTGMRLKVDDGLHAVLVGTGSPLSDIKRVGPCIAVIAGKKLFAVDTGDGSARNFRLAGLPIGALDAVFLTHYHSDHIGGLGEMMLQRWAAGAHKKPLDIIGPTGVELVVDGFNRAYKLDTKYRIAHHGEKTVPPSGAGGKAMPFALSDKEKDFTVVYDKDGVKVTAFNVVHLPVKPACGYKFEYKGRSIVISGDAAYSESVAGQATGADVLIHDALSPRLVNIIHDNSALLADVTIGKITKDILNYHASPKQAAQVAQKAGVKQLVLTHIIPPLPSSLLKNAFLGDAQNYYQGKIVMGVDGMLISLPSNTDSIKIRKLF